jgi:DNA-binding MarR family transcriptional regulator
VSAEVLEQTAAHVGEELFRLFAQLRRSVRRHTARPVELAALTGAQLELVRLVRRRPGLSVADAASELQLAPNTVSTLVRQLGERGLLRRTVDASDRRIARLDLSPEMRRKVDAWRDRRLELVGAAIDALPGRDRRRLESALPALARLAEELGAET